MLKIAIIHEPFGLLQWNKLLLSNDIQVFNVGPFLHHKQPFLEFTEFYLREYFTECNQCVNIRLATLCRVFAHLNYETKTHNQ